MGVRSGQKNCHPKSEALQMRERLEHGHPPPSFTLLSDLSTESFLFFQEKQQQQQRARKAQSKFLYEVIGQLWPWKISVKKIIIPNKQDKARYSKCRVAI